MDAASHEDWPVQRLADVSHVSEAHFARAFKEAFGVAPHRYPLTRRMERAVALLRARAAAGDLHSLLACIVSAALRPDLKTAVLEKNRRRLAGDTKQVL